MATPHVLLARLDAIGQSLAQTGEALALLGLGSVGQEYDRLDRYSDIDFFAIVKPGTKAKFLHDLGWMAAVHPIAYAFPNTVDGCKLLFADGIFCEYAVFEPAELVTAVYTAARIVWQAPEFDAKSVRTDEINLNNDKDLEWLLGEALTNLYVGLSRYHRGEKLSAQRFIQHYAVDRVLELIARMSPPKTKGDPFSLERRFEQRFSDYTEYLPRFVPGYEKSIDAAAALLEFLDRHFTVNAKMKLTIQALIEQA